MDGPTPAVILGAVVTSLRKREVNGLIELPKPPKFRRGALAGLGWDAVDQHGDPLGRFIAALELEADSIAGPLIRLPCNQDVVCVGIGLHIDRHDAPPFSQSWQVFLSAG
jgi:hypothetical protein